MKTITQQNAVRDQELQMVMLSTKKPSQIFMLIGDLAFEEYPNKSINAGNKHLYFLSDKEIINDNGFIKNCEVGDYIIYDNQPCEITHIGMPFNFKGTIEINNNERIVISYNKGLKTIVATTDNSLLLPIPESLDMYPMSYTRKSLPKPSKEFILSHIDSFNKGNRPEKIIVEFEISQKIGELTFIGGEEKIVEDIWLAKSNNEWYFDTNKKLDSWSCTYKLKVNEDNIINIKTPPEKPIYTETELSELIEKYDREFKMDTFAYTRPCSFTVQEWINKNLKK